MAVPADVPSFFAQYKTLVLRYATLARTQGADTISIGNESTPIAGPLFRPYWLDIIGAVRAAFPGKLTYGALPNLALPATLANLEAGVSFWDQLDYIGFSVYPVLSTSPNPTRAELEQGWRRNFYTGIDNVTVLQEYAAITRKQVIFTEVGFISSTGAAANPGRPAQLTDVPNNQLQALLYDVMFQTINARAGDWLAGIFLWQLPSSNASNAPWLVPFLARDYGFIGKPAADVVAMWYSESSTVVRRMADRVFDWAEGMYPGVISPSGVISESAGPYYFRYYPRTDNYLGVSGNRLLYFDPSVGGIRDLGTLTSWFVNIP
jgi:hypothetical protein